MQVLTSVQKDMIVKLLLKIKPTYLAIYIVWY